MNYYCQIHFYNDDFLVFFWKTNMLRKCYKNQFTFMMIIFNGYVKINKKFRKKLQIARKEHFQGAYGNDGQMITTKILKLLIAFLVFDFKYGNFTINFI